MVSRVSLASPCSARFQELLKSASRVLRSVKFAKCRLLGRVLQRHNVAFNLACLGGSGGSGDFARRCSPASAALSVVTKAPCLGGGEQLGLKVFGQAGELFVELLELDLVGFAEIGAGVDELVVVVLDQALSFGIELERIALLVDGGDALKELVVRGRWRRGGQRAWAPRWSAPSAALDWCWRRPGRRTRQLSDVSSWPLFSMATMVLSNVGGAGLLAMAWISLICSAMPASIAGW